MRHCSLDRNAPNALAAAILCAQNRLGINLNVDTSLNEDIDNDVINELKQTTPNSAGSTLLKKMGETYLNGLEAIRKAKERAAEAALAREREENWSLDQDSNEYEGSEEEVFGGFEYGDEEGFYDYDDSYEGNGNTYFDNDVNYSYDEY